MNGRWREPIAADFLESSAADFAAPYLGETLSDIVTDEAGAIVGRYRLVREIGRGGMGSVWLAERADGQFEQRAALKLIRRGLDSDEILERFLRERQILARLEHPNIARLMDGGVSDDGRPYFVMEFVDGLPITDYCATHHLEAADRLRLFVVTCRALQHAHQSLVVHRDLKPSNVLVTEQGEVKLLDFGIATSLRDDESSDGRGKPRAMTPGYASPEQRSARPVTTASDVYQLGILLHELLTGRRPDERVPPKLRGQLVSIGAMALQPDPKRRYASVEALADDVERYLSHRPIRHATTSRRVRLGLFLRRHHVRVASAVTLAAIGAIVGTTYIRQIRAERDRAEREAAKASETAALMSRFFQGWSPDAADRGKVDAGTVLSDAVQRATRELEHQPEMLAATLSTLGDLFASLNRGHMADSLFTRALIIQEAAGAASAGDLATTLARRGRLLHSQGRLAEAESTQRRAIALFESIAPARQMELLHTRADLGSTLTFFPKRDEAEALLRGVLRQSADPDDPFTMEVASSLGFLLFHRARYEEAVAILRPTLARERRVLGMMHRSTQQTLRRLASSLRGPESIPEAEQLDREALNMARALYGDRHVETYGTKMALCVLLEREGRFIEAEQLSRTTLGDALALFGESNIQTALTLRTLGSVLLAEDKRSEAEPILRRSVAAFRAAAPNGDLDEGDALNRLAYLAVERRAPDAASVYARAVEFERARKPADPYFVTDGYQYVGRAAFEMRDTGFARALLKRSVELYDAELPPGHVYRTQSRNWLSDMK